MQPSQSQGAREARCQAGRHECVGDGKSQDHKEGQPVLSVLDGKLAGRRKGAKRAPRELRQDG